jgi:hypothetical protein
MPQRAIAKPMLVTPPQDAPEVEEEPQPIIDEMFEDDQTIAAAPDASAFAPRVHVPKPAHVSIYANLFFRRTLIPILLTCGLMLPAIGIWTMTDPNAPLAAVGRSVDVLLIVVGAVLLGLGLINALHVRHILNKAAERQKS